MPVDIQARPPQVVPPNSVVFDEALIAIARLLAKVVVRELRENQKQPPEISDSGDAP